MSKHERETQEVIVTGCHYSCQSIFGFCCGLILGIPPLILTGLDRNAQATVACGLQSSSYLAEIGIIFSIVAFVMVLFLILGSIFWQKSIRAFTFGLVSGFLLMLVPLLLTEWGAFADNWQRCFQLGG